MRQQFFNPAGLVRGQPSEHILEIGVRVMPIHARWLDQAHDGSRAFARTQTAGKQPVIPADSDGPDLVLNPIVINRQLPVIGKADECCPTLDAAIRALAVADPSGNGSRQGSSRCKSRCHALSATSNADAIQQGSPLASVT